MELILLRLGGDFGLFAGADARTTMRYDMARANLGRHASPSVAAYLAGMAMG